MTLLRSVRHFLVWACLILATSTFAGTAFAQTQGQTDPSSVLREQQRQLQRRELQETVPSQRGGAVTAPAPPLSAIPPRGGPKIFLKAIEFEPSAFLTKEELNAIAAPYIGRRVDVADLQTIVKAVNDLYQARGYVTAAALLPPQDLKSGVVKIKLVEGKLSQFRIQGAAGNATSYLERSTGHAPGDVVDVPKLSQNVNTFNWTNEAQMRSLLMPGASFGLTDIVLAVTEPPRDTLQLFFDNQGVQSTGQYQGGVYYKRYGILGFDDRFTFYGTNSEAGGALAGTAAYNLAITPTGGRFGVTYSKSKIKIIDGPTAPLGITGDSQIATATLSHPVWLNSTWMLLASLGGSYGESRSNQDDVPITNNLTRKLTPGFTFARKADDLSFTISPTVSFTETNLRTVERTQRFTLFNGTGYANLRLPQDFYVTLLGAWQYSQERVLPGDQSFQIGGPTTVRGFPTNSMSGYSGYYFNLELHKSWNSLVEGLDTFAFLDRGTVWALDPNVTDLTSIGIGLRWTILRRLTAEVAVAFPTRQVLQPQPNQQVYFRITSHILGM